MDYVRKSFLPIALLLSGCMAVVVEKPEGPEAIIPGSPGPTFVWVGGSWTWDNQARVYVFREGYWTEPRKKSAVWVNGHWKETRGGWKYIRGHWKY